MRPVLEAVPYGHTWQCSQPGEDEYAPGVQRAQRYWPACDLAKPGRHRRSVVRPPSRITISTPAFGTATDGQTQVYLSTHILCILTLTMSCFCDRDPPARRVLAGMARPSAARSSISS